MWVHDTELEESIIIHFDNRIVAAPHFRGRLNSSCDKYQFILDNVKPIQLGGEGITVFNL